jgi:amidophosphoribosyltransferase
MCGIVGVLGPDQIISDLHDGLQIVQHRGQDAAGIMTYDGVLHTRHGNGLVSDAFSGDDLRLLTGPWGIGHTRYPTVGAGTLEDAQPFFVNAPYGIAMAHNGNVTNFTDLKANVAKEDRRHINSNCDVEVILNVFAGELERRPGASFVEDLFGSVAGVFQRVKGSYSAVGFVLGKGMFAFRDRYGIKPLIYGVKESPDLVGGQKRYMFASESAALTAAGFEIERDVRPGEAIFITPEGEFLSCQAADAKHYPCIFEYIYFARPDSLMDDVSVYRARLRLGEELGKAWMKTGREVDVVIPVPDSSRPAALAIAQTLGVPYREGLLKNRYVGRTFIMPGHANRKKSVRAKLATLRLEIEGKRVLLVDDSIVRGTTSREIVSMVRAEGAARVDLAISCPPLKYQCVYGIDMSTRNEFVARRCKDIEGIRKEIAADFLLYQDIDATVRACKWEDRIEHFCKACMDGKYPTGDVTQEVLDRIESERTGCQSR